MCLITPIFSFCKKLLNCEKKTLRCRRCFQNTTGTSWLEVGTRKKSVRYKIGRKRRENIDQDDEDKELNSSYKNVSFLKIS